MIYYIGIRLRRSYQFYHRSDLSVPSRVRVCIWYDSRNVSRSHCRPVSNDVPRRLRVQGRNYFFKRFDYSISHYFPTELTSYLRVIAYRNLCPKNYFCPTGTGDSVVGTIANDAVSIPALIHAMVEYAYAYQVFGFALLRPIEICRPSSSIPPTMFRTFCISAPMMFRSCRTKKFIAMKVRHRI